MQVGKTVSSGAGEAAVSAGDCLTRNNKIMQTKKVRPAKDEQTELFTIKQPLLWEKIFTYTSNNKTRTDPTNM